MMLSNIVSSKPENYIDYLYSGKLNPQRSKVELPGKEHKDTFIIINSTALLGLQRQDSKTNNPGSEALNVNAVLRSVWKWFLLIIILLCTQSLNRDIFHSWKQEMRNCARTDADCLVQASCVQLWSYQSATCVISIPSHWLEFKLFHVWFTCFCGLPLWWMESLPLCTVASSRASTFPARALLECLFVVIYSFIYLRGRICHWAHWVHTLQVETATSASVSTLTTTPGTQRWRKDDLCMALLQGRLFQGSGGMHQTWACLLTWQAWSVMGFWQWLCISQQLSSCMSALYQSQDNEVQDILTFLQGSSKGPHGQHQGCRKATVVSLRIVPPLHQ